MALVRDETQPAKVRIKAAKIVLELTRPDRVRKVRHEGAHYKLDALHLSEPSPQRTPVLYQAGTSPAGRAFAARHAECVFMSGPSKKVIAPRVAAIRGLAGENGRDPRDILMFAMATVVVAATDDEARAKLADYRRYADPEGALTLMSGWTGVDFSRLDPDQVVEHVESEAGRTALENITRADPDRRWTVREVAEHVSIGGIGPVIVGSPATVADQLEAWIDETDLDGFNLAFVVRPETFADVVDLADGYVRQDYAIALAEKAGFTFIGSSEISANSKDTANWPKGVWTLPPTFALGDQDREKYADIGEADNFVLKFRKPTQ